MLLELALLSIVSATPGEGVAPAAPMSQPPMIQVEQAPAPGTPGSSMMGPPTAESLAAPTVVPVPVPVDAPLPGAALPPPVEPPSGDRVIQARMVDEAPPAPAPAPTASAPPAVSAKADAPKSNALFGADWMGDITHFGVTLETGLPDGVSLNALFRPWYCLRGGLGYANNGISHGIKGGVTLVAFNFPITPALQLEMGHFFRGSGGPLADMLPDELKDSLSYSYYTGSIGFDVGSQKRFVSFVRVGLSRVNATVGGIESKLQEAANSTTLEADDGKLRAGIPHGKIGFAFFFL